MKRRFHKSPAVRGAAAAFALGMPLAASAQNPLVNGKNITLPPVGTLTQTLPNAQIQRGYLPNIGSHAANLVASPDGKYAVATDLGYREYLSSVNTTTGALVSQVPYDNQGTGVNRSIGLFFGLVFNPIQNSDGTWTLYAAQGNLNKIAILKLDSNTGALTVVTDGSGNAVTINSAQNYDFPAGLAISADGKYLYVANHQAKATTSAASLSIFDTTTAVQVGRFDFTQANGAAATVSIPAAAGFFAAGTASNFPYAIAVKGNTVYVACTSDDVYAIDVTNKNNPVLTKEIATGLRPLGLLVSGNTLYVANAHSDTISVVSTQTNTKIADINLRPNGALSVAGVTPNQMAVSPDGKTLYAALSDFEAVALIDTATNKIKGEIPVGWYPTAVVATGDGKRILVSNARGSLTRYPNPGQQVNTPRNDSKQYTLNQIEATVETIQVPTALKLIQYTGQVLANNHITPTTDSPANNPLYNISKAKGGITHVFYIIRENRTYDQVLGDLNSAAEGNRGNGDPTLALFIRPNTPNTHALADRFVLADNFYDMGDASMEGWNWSTAALSSEHNARNQPYNYSSRGSNYDSEGTVNNYPVAGFPAGAFDQNNNALPQLPSIPDLAVGSNGRIGDTILAAGNTLRDYGALIAAGYPAVKSFQPGNHYDATMGVFSPAKFGNTDLDFAGYNNSIAESPAPFFYASQPAAPANNGYLPKGNNAKYGQYTPTVTISGTPVNAYNRFGEWNREFTAMLANDPTGSTVPNFELVRFGRNHTNGINANGASAKAMVADNDYAVGKLIEAISNSPIWAHSAIFILEDDAQNGPDHVDSHRSDVYVVSPYIKQSTISSKFYNTASVLHSIELLLNAAPLTQFDAIADPFTAVWDNAPNNIAPYTAVLPAQSYVTEVLAPGSLYAKAQKDEFNRLMKLAAKMDFTHADAADPALLNEMVWKSVKGFDSKMPAPKTSPLVEARRAKTSTGSKAAKVKHDDDD